MAITARVTTTGGLAESLGLVVGTGSTLTPNMPNGWAEGDRLFVVAIWRQGVRQTHTITDYTLVGASAYRDLGNFGVGLAIYERSTKAGASESAPLVTASGGTNRGWGVTMIAVRDAGDAQAGITNYVLSNDGDDFVEAVDPFVPDDLNAPSADGMLIQFVAGGNDIASVLDTADQGFTQLAGGADHDSAVGADFSFAAATKVPTASGTQTAPAFTGSATFVGIGFHVA